MKCGASVFAMRTYGIKEKDTSEDAARGTVLHTITAECLRNNREAWEFAGQKFKEDKFEFTIDEDMVVQVQHNVDYVWNFLKKYPGAILHVEKRVYSTMDADAHGTADIRVEVPGLFIAIMDAKYGMVRVEPDDDQLKQYGYYSYERRSDAMKGAGEPTDVWLFILQHRLPNPKDWVRDVKFTVEQLSDYFHNEVLPALRNTRNPDALFVMGKHCTFCPVLAAARCKAQTKATSEIPVEVPSDAMSNEQLGYWRSRKKIVMKFFDGIDNEVLTRVRDRGETVPGAKAVHKMGNRAWKEGIEIELDGKKSFVDTSTLLADRLGKANIYTVPELKSPAQMEKVPGGKAMVSLLAFKPDTGITIADEDDSREPVVGLMQLMDQRAAAAIDVGDL